MVTSSRGRDWLYDPTGEPRGYVDPGNLRELWFHTGTVCNLRCSFCLEGSKPGDNRLNALTRADVEPYLDEAVARGVDQFSFTGGEPFVIDDMIEILDAALEHRPCLVLTNATEPLLNRLARVNALRHKPHPLRFRVSLDYPDPERHDQERGPGNFRLSLEVMGALHREGFQVSIARQGAADEEGAAVDAAFRPWLEEAGLPGDTLIVSFPEFYEPGANPAVPHITEDCMTRYKTADERAAFMCAFSKMVVKRNGSTRVYACTLVDDDPDYDMGATLAEAMEERVMLKHHRCYSCFANGASCSEL